MGERELPDRLSMEHLKTEERVVEETHTAPCSPFNCGDCAGGQQAYAANTVGPRKANFAPPARWAGGVSVVMPEGVLVSNLFSGWRFKQEPSTASDLKTAPALRHEPGGCINSARGCIWGLGRLASTRMCKGVPALPCMHRKLVIARWVDGPS